MAVGDQPIVGAVPAATVVLLRDSAAVPGHVEAFLVERPAAADFLPRAHVFPGGRVDPDDGDPRLLALCDGADSLVPGAAGHEPVLLATHGVAAIRELFEEAGVLLARVGSPRGDTPPARDLVAARAALRSGTTGFSSLCVEQRWRPALDRLTPLAHWVTPRHERRRFDTRFFLAALPPSQDASADGAEAVSGRWVDPAAACQQYEAGLLALAPPTVRTLADLAARTSVDDAVTWARGCPYVRVMPSPVERQGQLWLVLPGDPLHTDKGPGLKPPTRYVEIGGRWRPAPPDPPERG